MNRKFRVDYVLKIIVILLILTLLCGCNTKPVQSDFIITPVRTQQPTATAAITPVPTPTPAPTFRVPESYTISDFPIVYQEPELPTGCEVTALTMLLQYYGYDVDKMTMVEDYLPTLPRKTWKGEDGKTYGPDLYNYFVGDPAKASGTICGAGAIETAANAYLADVESNLQALDITGTKASELYTYVARNVPVFVCATEHMNDRKELRESWYTEDGRKVGWAPCDHGVVLIGYSEDKVTVGDPGTGLVTYSREQFEKVYVQRDSQAVILQKKGEEPVNDEVNAAPTATAAPTPTPTITATPVKTPEKTPTAPQTPTATKSATKQPASTPAATGENKPLVGHVISEFPIIYQNPELPTGCEITALTMILHYYGYDVDKVTMAKEYLPTIRYLKTYQGEDGKKYGSDMYNNFIGDPTKEDSGIICGAGAIKKAANDYLEEKKSTLLAKDITGTKASELYAYVDRDTPVFVCVTISMANRKEIKNEWYTEEGRLVNWSKNDHGAVLIGYSDEKVTIADPISGLVTYSRAQFEKVYAQRGCQAVILQ